MAPFSLRFAPLLFRSPPVHPCTGGEARNPSAPLRAHGQRLAMLGGAIRGGCFKTIGAIRFAHCALRTAGKSVYADMRVAKMKIMLSLTLHLIVILSGHEPLLADNKQLSTVREIPDHKTSWKSILVEPAGFSFSVPSTSRVNNHRMMSSSSEYIRIMNYTPRENPYLGHGEFWLEIHIINRDNKQGAWKSCAELIVHGNNVNQNGVKVYLGYPSERSPDVGASMKAQCVEIGSIDIYMQGAEGTSNTPLLNKIYSTLRVPSRRAQ